MKPLKVNKRIILGPGPSSANPEVLKSLSNPILGYLDPEFFKVLDDVRSSLKSLFRTNDNKITFFFFSIIWFLYLILDQP